MSDFALRYRDRRRKPRKPGEQEQGYRCRLPVIDDVVMLETEPPPPPRVGIFWQVWNRTYPALITDSVPVDES